MFRFDLRFREDRIRLVSLGGAAILVVLITTAIAVWLNSGGSGSPLPTGYPDPFGLSSGQQPGSSASPTPWPPGSSPPPGTGTSSPSPLISTSTPQTGTTSARYETLSLLGLGLLGFDTKVTVTNPGRASWTVVLTMPSDRSVENRSPGVVNLTRNGKIVTLTPVDPTATSVVFTIRFPHPLALGQAVDACTVDGRPCTGA